MTNADGLRNFESGLYSTVGLTSAMTIVNTRRCDSYSVYFSYKRRQREVPLFLLISENLPKTSPTLIWETSPLQLDKVSQKVRI